jgi:hypothetical protein
MGGPAFPDGTRRDQYFFLTDPAMTARTVVETYTGRWKIEVTFQEMRSYLGLESTHGRTRNAVLRAAPCLVGVYPVVARSYAEMPTRFARVRLVDRPGRID